MLFAGRIIDGITGGNISTAQAYIADVTTEENRAKGMGLIGAAFGLGFIFGPALGGILSKWDLNVAGRTSASRPFLFAGLLSLANASCSTSSARDGGARPPRARVGGGGPLVAGCKALRRPRLAFVLAVYFLFVTAFSMMTIFVRPVHALPLRLRRARHGLDIRLRRRDRRGRAGRADREAGEDVRRARCWSSRARCCSRRASF